jgi:hypothetical protein
MLLFKDANPSDPTTNKPGIFLLGLSKDFSSVIIFACDVFESSFYQFACFLDGISDRGVEFVAFEVY